MLLASTFASVMQMQALPSMPPQMPQKRRWDCLCDWPLQLLTALRQLVLTLSHFVGSKSCHQQAAVATVTACLDIPLFSFKQCSLRPLCFPVHVIIHQRTGVSQRRINSGS